MKLDQNNKNLGGLSLNRAPDRTRTDTGRILSPSWELSCCQNIRQLTAAQARVLAT